MHNLCSGTQYTLDSKGAQVVISPSKQGTPSAFLDHCQHGSPQTLKWEQGDSLQEHYCCLCLYFNTPLSLRLLASSQGTSSPMDTFHPSHSPSLTTCPKGVVPRNNKTACHTLLFLYPKETKQTNNNKTPENQKTIKNKQNPSSR